MIQIITNHIAKKFANYDDLHKQYKSHPDYALLQIENFIPIAIVRKMAQELDAIPLDQCKHFTRKNSCMYEHNKLFETPIANEFVNVLHSAWFLQWLEKVTGTKGLIPDPHLIGAGYMKSFAGDSLQIHSDFNWNDQLRLHRVVSLIVYLNQDWKDDWGGQLNFYDNTRQKIHSSVPVGAGNCVIWDYNNEVFHGYPDPIQCPKGLSRKGIRLFYYASNASHDKTNPPHRSLYWFDEDKGKPYDHPWEK